MNRFITNSAPAGKPEREPNPNEITAEEFRLLKELIEESRLQAQKMIANRQMSGMLLLELEGIWAEQIRQARKNVKPFFRRKPKQGHVYIPPNLGPVIQPFTSECYQRGEVIQMPPRQRQPASA